jgi:hypothetical protein
VSSGSPDYDQAKALLNYVADKYGNHYVTPTNQSVTITPGTTYSIGGGGGGGGGSSFIHSPKTFTTMDGDVYYDGVKYVPENMKLNKQQMSSKDMTKLVELSLQKYTEGDMVLIKVGTDTDTAAMSQLGMSLNANGIKYMYVGLVEPEDVDAISRADLHTSPDDQLTMLSRLAAVWETRPGLTFGQFLAMVFSTEGLARLDDNVLITALEKAYGVDSD